jgi:5-methyltetrahydropteroyltriglutamate--homocysteine methyltransferase
MPLRTEPIGSIPRPPELLAAVARFVAGELPQADLDKLYEQAVRDTLRRFEATGSPVVTDGEQRKPSFVTYAVAGTPGLSPNGVVIRFKDGHIRQLPLLGAGPFRYQAYADQYVAQAKKFTRKPVRQAVVSASAISLMYPSTGIADYSRAAFEEDLVREAATDIRRCLAAGADSVQIDFTEGRLSVKLDRSKQLLNALVDLNNRVLEEFNVEERKRIGVHTCPGSDRETTHSADIDYAELLPSLFRLKAGRFYLQLASEVDPARILGLVRDHAPADALIFVGVTDPIDPRMETPEIVRDRILQAAKFIDPSRLGSTDDCGFSPFADDDSTSRGMAFAKIRARIVERARHLARNLPRYRSWAFATTT